MLGFEKSGYRSIFFSFKERTADNKKSDKKIDMKSPEYADFNNWKNEILSKYAA